MKNAKLKVGKTKKRKRRYNRTEWEQIYDGCNDTFIIDPTQTILILSCCDCGSTHTHDFKVFKNGRIQIKIKKNYKATREIRYYENSTLEYKVTKPKKWF